MDPATTPKFKDTLILFQTLLKQRSISSRNYTSIKNSSKTNLQTQIQLYINNFIKFNEYTNNSNNLRFLHTETSKLLKVINETNNNLFQSVFGFIKNNPLHLYQLIKRCSDDKQKKTLANFINANIFKNIFTLQSAEDEFLILISKLIHDDLNVERKENEKLFVENSFMYQIIPLIRNSWEISQFLYELLIIPISFINNRNTVLDMDIKRLNEISNNKLKDSIDLQENHESSLESLYIHKTSSKYIELNNLRYNTLIEKHYENKTHLPSVITDKYTFLFDRGCGVSKATFVELLEKETNPAMIDYLNYHINRTKNNNTLYANIMLINKMNNLKNSEEISSIHITNCIDAASMLDMIIYSLLNYKERIPRCIKQMCKIIELEYRQKKKDASELEIMKVMMSFLFEMFIMPVIEKPKKLTLFDMGYSTSTQLKSLANINEILTMIIKGELFIDMKNYNLTKLNRYCIIAFKNIVDLFTQIKNEVNLPEYVNQFIENENKGVPENEQVKQKPNEILYNDFYLFSLEDVILISEIEGTITNSNEDQLTSNDIDIKDNKEDNEEVNKYNTCISILNNHISDFKQIYENDIKHKKKIFYFINEEAKLNNIEKIDSEYDAQFIEDIEFLIENIRTFDSLFFETYNLTSLESLILNLPKIMKDPQYKLLNNSPIQNALERITKNYETLTDDLKNKYNTSLLPSLINLYEEQINNTHLPELINLEELITIINSKNNEFNYLLTILEDKCLSDISKKFIEKQCISLETTLSKPFFNKKSAELIINEIAIKKGRKCLGVTETIKEFCDNFSQYKLTDFFSIDINRIIEQYHKASIPKEIIKVLDIIQSYLMNKEIFQVYVNNVASIKNIKEVFPIILDKISIYIICRLECVLCVPESSGVDSKLVQRFLLCQNIDISSEVETMKTTKISKLNECIGNLINWKSSCDIIFIFLNIMNLIEDSKPLKKQVKLLVILFYFIKFHFLNLNSMLDYINCFLTLREEKLREIFMLMNKTASFLLKNKYDNVDKAELIENIHQRIIDDLLSSKE